MKRKLVLSLMLVLMLLMIMPFEALATTYSIDASFTYHGAPPLWGDYPLQTDPNRLVRWPDGTLWTVYTKQVAGVQEVFIGNSTNNGLNWNLTQLTSVGVQQAIPSIAMASNWDLDVLWSGIGESVYPTKYALKRKHYTYATHTWSATEIVWVQNTPTIANPGVKEVHAQYDGSDNLFVAFNIYDYASGASHTDLYCIKKEWNGSGWDAWDTAETIESGLPFYGMAGWMSLSIDHDNVVGIARSDEYQIKLWLRDPATETWSGTASLNGSYTRDWRPSLMASTVSGSTYWRVIWASTDAAHSIISYAYYATVLSAWSGVTALYTGGSDESTHGTAMGQEHSTSIEGDTGDFYAIYAIDTGAVDNIYYRKNLAGVWQGAVTAKTDTDLAWISATKSLFPYYASADWHWNMPLQNLAMVYAGSDAGTWTDGDEYQEFYISGNWGAFRPIVTTEAPDNLLGTSADFHGTIWAPATDILNYGWQWGYTATPTWGYSIGAGNYTYGAKSYTVSTLDLQTTYYVRFFAVNATGTSYGSWIGFATGGSSPLPTPTGNGTTICNTTAYNFLAIPVTNTDIKLTWDWWPVSGNSSVQIAIYYRLYHYPNNRIDGTLIYQGTGDAYTHTNLTPGTTYYYRAWPLCGGNYSADYVQDWATTYGSSPVVSPPEQPEGWFQDPNCIAYSKIPLLSDALIAVTTAYGFPATTVCVMFTLLWIIVLGLAVFLFIHSAMMMIITIAVLIILASIMGLLPLWMIVIAICLGGISIYISGRT